MEMEDFLKFNKSIFSFFNILFSHAPLYRPIPEVQTIFKMNFKSNYSMPALHTKYIAIYHIALSSSFTPNWFSWMGIRSRCLFYCFCYSVVYNMFYDSCLSFIVLVETVIQDINGRCGQVYFCFKNFIQLQDKDCFSSRFSYLDQESGVLSLDKVLVPF